MKKKIVTLCQKNLLFSLQDTLVTVGTLAAASLLCFLLRMDGAGDQHVPMIFILAVLVVALMTDGYFYSLFTSLLAVLGVNWAFTYPYFHIDFTLANYPLTFFTMFSASIVTSTLTARLKNHEKLRRESERESMRANLLRAISHDLRTPLTSIEGSVTAVLENPDTLTPAQQTQLLTETRDSARWLIRMVENLLSITRMDGEGNAARLNKQPELVEEVVGEVLGKFRRSYPCASVAVEIPAEPLLVPMDAMLVEQVLGNLLENAVLHGRPDVSIALSVEETADAALFTVTDDGPGIPPERLPTLFSGYQGAYDAPVEESGKRGMGIGLSVCLSILRAHGGQLTGGNRSDGSGARFQFTLPLDKGGMYGDPQ